MRTEFFLGANSAEGFYSLYDEYCREKGGFLHLIKGGPGGGKSGFMRKIGEKAENLGYDVEYIRCSGDPESLDAVYIKDLSICYVDATSPHVLEPTVFGTKCDYVNLGQFCAVCCDEKIENYTQLYKDAYRSAYSYLSAANSVNNAEIRGLYDDSAVCKLNFRAENTFRRELGNGKDGGGKTFYRFIRGISCSGQIIMSTALSALCKQIYSLDDRFGLEQLYFDALHQYPTAHDRIVCPSPLDPKKTDAVLFPENSLAFVSSSLLKNAAPYRHIRLDALTDYDAVRKCRGEIRHREALYRELTDTAIYYLGRAKEYHDLLENAYHPFIDFPALTEFTESEIEKLFK